jgi:hypothetical protein
MAAALPPLLSDARPEIAEKAGLGGRFHYWRGRSGRRYLFTSVPRDSLGDFRSVVVLFAEPAAGGRMIARSIAMLDALGRMAGSERTAAELPAGAVALIHLLAGSEAERQRVVADLAASSLRLAA